MLSVHFCSSISCTFMDDLQGSTTNQSIRMCCRFEVSLWASSYHGSSSAAADAEVVWDGGLPRHLKVVDCVFCGRTAWWHWSLVKVRLSDLNFMPEISFALNVSFVFYQGLEKYGNMACCGLLLDFTRVRALSIHYMSLCDIVCEVGRII